MKVLTAGRSFALVELDFVDFFPRSTDFIHLAGDFPIVAYKNCSNTGDSGPAVEQLVSTQIHTPHGSL